MSLDPRPRCPLMAHGGDHAVKRAAAKAADFAEVSTSAGHSASDATPANGMVDLKTQAVVRWQPADAFSNKLSFLRGRGLEGEGEGLEPERDLLAGPEP